jgi:hypothetical protein
LDNEEDFKQPSNSSRLYAILNAITGDTDASLWNLNGVATLASLVRKVGLKETEDDTVSDVAGQALMQVNHMLEKLSVALSGLPEYLPRTRRPDEIELLKQEWLAAGQFYPIETTSGFAAHAEDLRTWRLEIELAQLRGSDECCAVADVSSQDMSSTTAW